ncbi:MAG TPA: hypothetical protein VGX92_21160 [Pyrinomonadaceae bacterium]|jgi:ElaB/YqjD/DUF883 family membrane-anchored ribosome-binding protein|nr:hypothetical protein [Pyrinomonadaceae bacterium]
MSQNNPTGGSPTGRGPGSSTATGGSGGKGATDTGATGTGTASASGTGASGGSGSSTGTTGGGGSSSQGLSTTGGGSSSSGGGQGTGTGAATGLAATAQEYGKKVADAATTAKDYVSDKMTPVVDKIKDLQNTDVREVANQAKDYARQNPGQAILISAAAGLVLGLLIRGSRR